MPMSDLPITHSVQECAILFSTFPTNCRVFRPQTVRFVVNTIHSQTYKHTHTHFIESLSGNLLVWSLFSPPPYPFPSPSCWWCVWGAHCRGMWASNANVQANELVRLTGNRNGVSPCAFKLKLDNAAAAAAGCVFGRVASIMHKHMLLNETLNTQYVHCYLHYYLLAQIRTYLFIYIVRVHVPHESLSSWSERWTCAISLLCCIICCAQQREA